MENEEIVEVDEIPELPKVEDGQDDTTDYKAEALKYQGIAKRYKTKFEKSKEVKPEVKPEIESKPTGEFDYAQKAYLAANGFKDADELKVAQDIIKATGKSLDEVIESKYFLAEINELREQKKTKDAIPSKTNRSGNSSKDNVDYWINKGELPPKDQWELRTKVVNERIKRENGKNIFA